MRYCMCCYKLWENIQYINVYLFTTMLFWTGLCTLEGLIQLCPVPLDKVAVIFSQPQEGITAQIYFILAFWRRLCQRNCRAIHSVTLRHTEGVGRKKREIKLGQWKSMAPIGRLRTTSDLLVTAVPLMLPLQDWLVLGNPDRSACNRCRPTSQTQGPTHPRRPLIGRWLPFFRDGPRGKQLRPHDQGDASPREKEMDWDWVI